MHAPPVEPAPSAEPSGLSADLARAVARGFADEPVGRDEARAMLRCGPGGTPLLLLAHAAGLVRRRFFGDRVRVHILHNVQNGACPEDCGYCGQSRDSAAPIQPYRLKAREEIIAEAERAKASGAFRYCMVLSGRGPDERDIEHMADCIREIKGRLGLRTCLSSGLLDEAMARRLRDAGLDRLNHNLNTSEAHYPAICTTHTYADRVETLRAARSAGLGLCSGLIVGMGETSEDLLDAVYALRGLRVESIPVNFLVPFEGNRVRDPVCDGAALTPEFCLRVLCVMRLVNPTAEVRMAAGREGHLRSLQALALEPANSLFVDGYLLTKGSNTLETLRLVRDAGFRLELEGDWPEELRALTEDGALDAFHNAQGEGCGRHPVIKDERLSERKLARLAVRGVAIESHAHHPRG